MRRLVAGGLALGLTSVGALALAGPVGAQEEPEPEEVLLEATLSASVVAPGEELTATPVEPCTVPDEGEPGELYWVAFSLDDPERFLEDHVPLEADGSWTVTFQASAEPGDYEFYAACLPGDLTPGEEEMLESLAADAPQTLGDDPENEPELPEGEEPEGEEPPAFEYYGPLPFTVDGGDGPGTEEPPAQAPAPPAAAPAQPVVGNPTFTG